MNVDEKLIVMLEARVSEFEKKFRGAERTGTRSYRNLERGSTRATRRMESDMNRTTTRLNQALGTTAAKFGQFGKAFGAGLLAGGAAAAATGIATGVRRATGELAQLSAEAKRAGVSVEALQALRFVGEQNRVGIDAMVDGLKELQLRADEFIVTGKGPAAEAFARINMSASDLARGLEKPDQLFLDIIGRLEELDDAARIRVADEIFGGTGGEQFVQLIDRGEAALRATAEQAYATGQVLDAEVIAKAEELDRRFSEMERRVGNALKAAVVNAADSLLNFDQHLDRTFAKLDAIDRFDLGDLSLDGVPDDLDAVAAKAEDIGAAYEDLTALASDAAQALRMAAFDAGANGFSEIGLDMHAVGEELDNLVLAYRENRIEAAQFGAELGVLTGQAEASVNAVDGLNGLDMSGVIGQIGGVTSALGGIVSMAAAAAQAVLSIPGTGDAGVYGEVGARGDPRDFVPASDLAPETSTRPARPPFELGVPNVARPVPFGGGGGGSGGGGGGRSPADEFRELLEETRQETLDLEAEAAAMLVLAASGRDVGDALEFARRKTELLREAQAAGKEITPALEAEIDALAEAYARAGVAASDAADDLRKIEERSEAGAARMTDIFSSVLSGSLKAKDAIAGLLIEMGKVQLLRGFTGLASSGADKGVLGALGGMLGFASGGYTGDRPETEVAGVVHGREGVLNARAMRTPGAREMMESLNAGRFPQAAATSNAGAESGGTVRVVGGDLTLSDGGAIMAQVQVVAENNVRAGIVQYDRTLPGRVNKIRATTHERLR